MDAPTVAVLRDDAAGGAAAGRGDVSGTVLGVVLVPLVSSRLFHMGVLLRV
jgi:hypothetical protein